tara:strand:- start:3955 stop:4260 length:306 start_codon:yes stop_codon:yes gene_type:complete
MLLKVIRFSLAIIAIAGTTAGAGELLYNPINPGFGGNPNNIDYLLNLAEIQNEFLESADSGSGGGGGGVPNISFPPITIDLGGTGGGASQNETPTTTAAQP